MSYFLPQLAISLALWLVILLIVCALL